MFTLGGVCLSCMCDSYDNGLCYFSLWFCVLLILSFNLLLQGSWVAEATDRILDSSCKLLSNEFGWFYEVFTLLRFWLGRERLRLQLSLMCSVEATENDSCYDLSGNWSCSESKVAYTDFIVFRYFAKNTALLSLSLSGDNECIKAVNEGLKKTSLPLCCLLADLWLLFSVCWFITELLNY